MIAVTGAAGQLGRLVIAELLKTTPAGEIIAIVRRPEAVADLAAQGVAVRYGDYDKADTLALALDGVERLLLISGSEVGKRAPQHRAVIDAAKSAGVKFIAYTSILGAPASPLGLAVEHRATEEALAASGIPHALLRHGWYAENAAMGVAPAIEHGAVIGCAGDGKISYASRADYAAADARVITGAIPASVDVYELAGDEGVSHAEFAAILAAAAGKPVAYVNMTQAEHAAALQGAGLPDWLAGMLADSDAGAGEGALFDGSKALSALIGRPTTPFASTIAAAIPAAA